MPQIIPINWILIFLTLNILIIIIITNTFFIIKYKPNSLNQQKININPSHEYDNQPILNFRSLHSKYIIKLIKNTNPHPVHPLTNMTDPIPKSLIISQTLQSLNKEFKILLNTNTLNSITLIIITIIIFIAINNSFGLLPYVFTATSHIIITLIIAFPLWVTLILFGWINNIQLIFAHMVPQGTPTPLMSFIVIIESIRNIIRPITLSVRLAANIIAGHLLISLLGDYTINSTLIRLPFILATQVLLLVLETAVAFIQSYVFVVLAGLYSTEIHH